MSAVFPIPTKTYNTLTSESKGFATEHPGFKMSHWFRTNKKDLPYRLTTEKNIGCRSSQQVGTADQRADKCKDPAKQQQDQTEGQQDDHHLVQACRHKHTVVSVLSHFNVLVYFGCSDPCQCIACRGLWATYSQFGEGRQVYHHWRHIYESRCF